MMSINLLYLMAGRGTRISRDVRYAGSHKALVPINGTPMSLLSYQNITANMHGLRSNNYLVISDEILKLRPDLLRNFPGAVAIIQNGYVNGPAMSAKLAERYVKNNEPLLVSNSDQVLSGTISEAIKQELSGELDGILFCFNSNDPRYSYVTVSENMIASSMVEKEVVSNHANTGLCFFRNGEDFFGGIDALLGSKESELYVSDVCDYLIRSGKKFKVAMIDFIDLGTPDDIEMFLEHMNDISTNN